MISAFEAFQPLYNLIVFDEASLNAYLFDKFCAKIILMELITYE